MAKSLNWDKLRHTGRPTEAAYAKVEKPFHSNPKTAANSGRSMSEEERARWAAANGYGVATKHAIAPSFDARILFGSVETRTARNGKPYAFSRDSIITRVSSNKEIKKTVMIFGDQFAELADLIQSGGHATFSVRYDKNNIIQILGLAAGVRAAA